MVNFLHNIVTAFDQYNFFIHMLYKLLNRKELYIFLRLFIIYEKEKEERERGIIKSIIIDLMALKYFQFKNLQKIKRSILCLQMSNKHKISNNYIRN